MAFPKLPVAATARPEISRDRRRSCVARFTERYIDGVSVPEPTRPVPAVPGWNVQDVTAHLITAIDRYAAGPGAGMPRAAGPADLPRLNERLLRERTWPAKESRRSSYWSRLPARGRAR